MVTRFNVSYFPSIYILLFKLIVSPVDSMKENLLANLDNIKQFCFLTNPFV